MRIHHLFLFVTFVCFATLQRGEAALASSSSSSPHPNVILDRVFSEHKEEINFGYKTYGSHPSQFYSDKVRKWEDDDLFRKLEIARGNAGPDEDNLGGNGHAIFQTKRALFSSMECDCLVNEAKQIIENQNLIRDQDGHLSNEAIGEVRVSNMPKGKPFLQSMMHETLFPLLESRFSTPSYELTLHDALIIGYGHLSNGDGPSKAQPIHRDSSLISLNIALSENNSYEGGGTYFEGLDGIGGGTIYNQQGHVLCHSGGMMHAGQSLKSGVRFVLVLFILAENIPQIARRCHAMGTRAEEKEQYSTASAAYSAGLKVAQWDHCLLRDFGRMNIALGRRNKGIKFLRQSDRSYAYCASCLITIGRTFLDERRPRAALRYFEEAIIKIEEMDRIESAWLPLRACGFNARYFAAQSGLMCMSASQGNLIFDKQFLQSLLSRIDLCLKDSPDDEYLKSMKSAALRLTPNN